MESWFDLRRKYADEIGKLLLGAPTDGLKTLQTKLSICMADMLAGEGHLPPDMAADKARRLIGSYAPDQGDGDLTLYDRGALYEMVDYAYQEAMANREPGSDPPPGEEKKLAPKCWRISYDVSKVVSMSREQRETREIVISRATLFEAYWEAEGYIRSCLSNRIGGISKYVIWSIEIMDGFDVWPEDVS